MSVRHCYLFSTFFRENHRSIASKRKFTFGLLFAVYNAVKDKAVKDKAVKDMHEEWPDSKLKMEIDS